MPTYYMPAEQTVKYNMKFIKSFNEFEERLNEQFLVKPQELITMCEESLPKLKEFGRAMPIRFTKTESVIRWKGNGTAMIKFEDINGYPMVTSVLVNDQELCNSPTDPSNLKDIKILQMSRG